MVKRGRKGEKEPLGAGRGEAGLSMKKWLQDRGLKAGRGRGRGGVKTHFKNS